MKQDSIKGLLYGTLSISVVIVSFILFENYKASCIKFPTQEAYERFLNNHPYAAAKNYGAHENEEGEHNPDRPDLAYQQDFLQTLDPALGYPPTDRLAAVYEYIAQQKKNRTTGTYQWTERGPSNVGGRTNAILFDPNDVTGKKVWAGGATGGLWYCNDITLIKPTWFRVNDFWENIAVTAIACDSTNKKVMYAGTGDQYSSVKGGGIWKTTDGGTTWNRLASTINNTFTYIQRIVVHPTLGDVYVATKSGLMKSTDGGTTWVRVLGGGVNTTNAAVCDLTIGADKTIYAAIGDTQTSDGIYTSKVGDANTFVKLNTGTNGFATSGFGNIALAAAPSDSNVVYAMASNTADQNVLGIWKSSDKGQTWVKKNNANDSDPGIGTGMARTQGWYDLVLAVDPNNANTLMAGAVDLFKSTDGGNSWSQYSLWYNPSSAHADQHYIVYKPGSSSTALFGNDGGIYYTDVLDNYPNLKDRNNTYNVTQFYSCAMAADAGSNNFLAGAQDNGSQYFTQNGFAPTTNVTGGDGAFCFIDQLDASIQIASYVYNAYYLTTSAWALGYNQVLNDANSGQFINPCDYDSQNKILYTAKSANDIYAIQGIDASPTPTTISSLAIGTIASHIKVSPYQENGQTVLFIGSQAGKVLKVNGATKTTISKGISGNVSCIEVGVDNNELLVIVSNYGLNSVWYTSDGGTTWQKKDGNLPDMPVRWALFNPGNRKEVMIATEVGVWSTDDISATSPTWMTNSLGMANVRTDMLKIRPSDGLVIAATHGRGLFSTNSFFTNVGVNEVIADKSVPITIYPNPTSEQIQLSVPVNRLELYNSLGQLVLLQNNITSAVNIRQLAMGNYIVHITVGNKHMSSKISISR